MVTKEERREQKRIYAKENREFWRAHGICVKCGKQRAFSSYRVCPECLEKENERKRKYVRTEEQRLRDNERQRKKRLEHKEQGLCPNCSRKASPGYVYCSECRAVMRRSNQAWVEKTGRKKGYAEAGLCIRCGADPVEGKRLCPNCLERQRESMAYARQFAPTSPFWARV